ncbi:M24 family metallopeptidase [Desulfopila aestuarii]|uniref:Xaa-Pro aminopeptidase n=1 Tax=Desulfopila aestuarii DSM 18488 TaxID=1121416 RepID=A0A1M7Y8V6_9BACT|nr:Xaa-Pro peptidase family protein [Desulfopila aestuarii]SHO49057.1 Xaa-Pro aminopeptidase [Desulfopila aestuarii DSM 18488]
MDYAKRIKKLQKKLRRKKVDALLVSQSHNRRYLSGFTATDHDISESSGVLLIPARGEGLLLTDFRYRQQAEQEVPHLQIKMYPRGLINLLKSLLPKCDIRKLGFESSYMLHSTHRTMKDAFKKKGIELVPLSGMIEKMRTVKDAEEIALIRESVTRNEQVFRDILPTITSSQTEIDIALALEQRMRVLGASSPSFATIVAAGENSALPHAVPQNSRIGAAGPLTIDMGLILNGYCSDMTRTFIPGKRVTKKYQDIHRIVRQAQLAGIATIKAGISGKEVDKAARDIIADAGYGDYFGHSLGHGVGLAVHEAPRLSTQSKDTLKAGMIVTVEPGIYIPGWGGIRLENMVIVTEDGCENLNSDTTWLDI